MKLSFEFILLLVFAISSCIDTGINIIRYEKTHGELNSCTDSTKYEAFYVIKRGIGYCFERNREYPYHIRGGIIDVDGE